MGRTLIKGGRGESSLPKIKMSAKTFFKVLGNLIEDFFTKLGTKDGREEFAKMGINTNPNPDIDQVKGLLGQDNKWDELKKAETSSNTNATLEQNNSITDMTDSNIEQAINGVSSTENKLDTSLNQSINLTEKLWEREDQIRKEVWDREDSAYQRAVEDALKAGINPNLINIQPASSGGGINNATNYNLELYKEEYNKSVKMLEQYLENDFKGSEQEKDRLASLIETTIQSIAKIIGLKMMGGS